ncbi:uridine kinase, partial [human gut metagenome]
MNVTVIGVAGGTGSGKSTLVKRLQEAFKEEEVVTLCHDYYYKAHPELTYEERTKLNYDHPQSFDTWTAPGGSGWTISGGTGRA